MRALLVFAVFVPVGIAQTTTVAHLPNTTVNAMQTDAAGNIYIAGYTGVAQTPAGWDAFVAKLSAAGQVIYSTSFAGSQSDSAQAIAIDGSGAAYIFGQTASTNFPVTTGALQTTLQAPNVQGFAAKVDPNGKVVYATYIGAGADIYPTGPSGAPASYYAAGGLVVDPAGDAILSGVSQTYVNKGAPLDSYETTASFVMKLDPLGAKMLASVQGVGGLLALDGGGNVYVAGTYAWNEYSADHSPLPAPAPIPITAGAFQGAYQPQECYGGEGLGVYNCPIQYVAKLNAGLTQTLYATYISGSWGAVPAAISVDAQGQVFVAGTTSSPDYPTTPNAFEPGYIVEPPPQPGPPESLFFLPPPSSGYVTELNTTGTGLIYSSFFSGTQADTITFAAFTAAGIYISGSAGADDLPGLGSYPPQCGVPAYATRLSADATAVGASRAVSGSVLGYDEAAGTLLAWNGSDLVAVNPNLPPPPIACILDAANLQPVSSVAPGELISIFGDRFTGLPPGPNDAVPPGNGVSVTANGLAASLLYASPQQINAQVPFGVAGLAQANIVFTSSTLGLEDSRTLPLVASQPVVFLDSSTAIASLCLPRSPVPLAFNADGTRNSCPQPAAAGSVVTIFLEGLGTPSPATAVTLSVETNSGIGGGPAVVNLTSVPGSISGVVQAGIQIPEGVTGLSYLENLKAGDIPAQGGAFPIWVH
jgi:uncharacterized protein (TIGR03437 family)